MAAEARARSHCYSGLKDPLRVVSGVLGGYLKCFHVVDQTLSSPLEKFKTVDKGSPIKHSGGNLRARFIGLTCAHPSYQL